MSDSWLRDLHFALRALRRQPGFLTAAVTTLALGIGAATAIFSVAYGVTLRPLPYPEPDRLLRIYEANIANGQPKQDVSVGTFHEWREGSPSIAAAALYTKPRTRFLAGAERDSIVSMAVSPAFFDVLGTRPALGRTFKAERQYSRSTLREVVVTDAAWRRLFGGDPAAVGRVIRFADDDDPFEVVGVLPASFQFTEPVDLFQPKIVAVPIARILRNWRYDRMIARLQPGATVEQARAELGTVSVRLARDFPTSNGGWSATVEPLHASIVGSFARASWLLLAGVGVVLLVACVSVGGLLIARAVSRDRETQVRVALGAGSWRLLRFWLAEASIIAAGGGAAGIAIAWLGVLALKAAAPPGIPRLDAIALDVPALVVAALATLLSIALFSAAPLAFRRQTSGLKGSGAGAGETPAQHLARGAVLIAQCAGAAALVVLAVMLTRSFVNLLSFDRGWKSSGVLSLTVAPPMPPELRRPWYRFVEWSDRLVQRLEATPGIARAAITTQVPLSPEPYPSTIARGRGKGAGDNARWPGVSHHVTDGYFDVMGIRLVDGRLFGPGERFNEAQVNWTEKADRGAAIVTEATARLLWPGQSPIGQALWLPDIDSVTWREVIGVVADIQFHAIGEAPAAHVFIPWTQTSTGRPRLVVRATAADAAGIVTAVREAIESVEPGTRVDNVATLDALVARATAQPRFTSRIVSAFGALALVLAAVGIYGTLSFVVGARTREIGVRIALGATPGQIMSRTLSRGLVPAAFGALIGVGAALAIARAFRALLFEIDPVDGGSMLAGVALLGVVAALAAFGPARRAARVDPVQALRAD
jgi:predicted permease